MPLIRGKNSEKGQILLIVVLASVIALTVGLAAISRSITNNRITAEEANSQKALSAAEAGIEEQLSKSRVTDNSGDLITFSNDAKFKAEGSEVSGPSVKVANGSQINQDEGADIWLSDPDFNTKQNIARMKLYWNDKNAGGCPNIAALEIVIVHGADKNNPNISRYAVDPCSRFPNSSGDAGDGSVNIGAPPEAFAYQHSFVFPSSFSDVYIVRVIPLYADIKSMAVDAEPVLPAQGYIIDSTGYSGTTVRKVRVYKEFPRVPIEFFPYNLFLP